LAASDKAAGHFLLPLQQLLSLLERVAQPLPQLKLLLLLLLLLCCCCCCCCWLWCCCCCTAAVAVVAAVLLLLLLCPRPAPLA
jgi:hypothetical protein